MRDTVITALLVASVAAPARAQDSDPAEHSPAVSATEDSVLRSRMRSGLHPDQPLRLRGREIDGNDMRSITPALRRGDTTTRGVERDDAYARTVAMYDQRARFHGPAARSAVAAAAVAGDVVADARAEAAEPVAQPASSAPASSRWSPGWVLGGIAAAVLALVGWMAVRARS